MGKRRRRRNEQRNVGLFPLIILTYQIILNHLIPRKQIKFHRIRLMMMIYLILDPQHHLKKRKKKRKKQIKKQGKTSKLVNSIKQIQVLKQLLKKLKKQVLYLNLKDSNYYQKEKGEERKLVLMEQIRKKKIL